MLEHTVGDDRRFMRSRLTPVSRPAPRMTGLIRLWMKTPRCMLTHSSCSRVSRRCSPTLTILWCGSSRCAGTWYGRTLGAEAGIGTRLTFPEPKEFALGVAMGSPDGSGTDLHYAEQMAGALVAITRVVERRVAYVEMFGLFVPGLGVDRISDIFCNILKSRFIAYTEQVCQRHGIAVEQVTVRNASWNQSAARWSDARLHLPPSPVTKGAVLAPDRFLQDIPLRITADGFYG